MGNVATITHDCWPEQSEYNAPGSRLFVCFHYDTKHVLQGEVVRNDAEEPHRMIIRLDDGRYVLGTECQFSGEPLF